MVPFGRSRYLGCFYCGQTSKHRNDGSVRDFHCQNCEATNYLDDNGEITDPPVAKTTATQPNAYYATGSSSSRTMAANSSNDDSIQPGSSTTMATTAPARDIFCSRCLKNQHLFTASLAQYLPDDPDHPDYAALERNYYRFRAGLEKRYPQVCADCEPRVLARVSAAGYAAKTDFLRRAVERTSRLGGGGPRQRSTAGLSVLDMVDTLGRAASWCGLMLQVFWHLAEANEILSERLWPSPKGQGWMVDVLRSLRPSRDLWSEGDYFAIWSFRATLLSVWWNPMFPQVYRGFSRHIMGLGQWYAFQVVLVALRYFIPQLTRLEAKGMDLAQARLAIHVFMAIMTFYITFLSKRTVRQDATPLFGPSPQPASSPQLPLSRRKEEATQNLSNVLDDILASPTPRASRSQPLEAVPPAGGPRPWKPMGALMNGRHRNYSSEMDWSPTPALPPALQATPQESQPFGHPSSSSSSLSSYAQGGGSFAAPPAGPQNPFWAKVPPAPKPAAHKHVTPVPSASSSIKQDREIFEARFGGGRLDPPTRGAGARSDVEFREPLLRDIVVGGGGAGGRNGGYHDGRPQGGALSAGAGLADLFGNSFSISQEEEREVAKTARKARRSAVRGGGGGRAEGGGGNNPRDAAAAFGMFGGADMPAPESRRRAFLQEVVGPLMSSPSSSSRLLDVAVLALVLVVWTYTMLHPSSDQAAVPSVQKAALAVGVVLTARVVRDVTQDSRDGDGWTPAAALGLVLCAAELAAAGHVAKSMWTYHDVGEKGIAEAAAATEIAVRGLGVLGVMWAHQIWNAYQGAWDAFD